MLIGIALALGSALTHAAWNTVVKRVSVGGIAALWAYSFAGLLVVLVVCGVATSFGRPPSVTPQLMWLAAVSTVLHTSYAAALQRAYRRFDVSQIYPVSRGLAPVMTALVALPLLGQRLTSWQLAGVLSMGVAVGILVTERTSPDRRKRPWQPVAWSFGIGGTVAAYTSFDGWAVLSQGVDPLSYYTMGAALQLGLITALLRGKLSHGVAQLTLHRRPIALLAVLIPMSYLLGLYATQHAPASLVAALRSSSLIWAALAAAVVLREGINRTRTMATVMATVSIVLLIRQAELSQGRGGDTPC